MAALLDPRANSQLSSENKSIHIYQDTDVHLYLTISQSWSPLSFLLLAQCCCIPGLFLYYLAYLFKSWWMKKKMHSLFKSTKKKKSTAGIPKGCCLVTKSCPTLLWAPWIVAHQAPLPMGFSRHILEWVAISFSRGSSPPRDWTCICYVGWQILYRWATRETQG